MRAIISAAVIALAAPVVMASEAASSPQYNKAGYVTAIEDGRLWVFVEGSKEYDDFRQHGEPVKQIAKIGAGPEGMTVKGPSMEVIEAYLAK